MTIAERIKKVLGIEGDTRETLLPMLSYGAKNISSEGALYVLSLYYQGFLAYVEGLGTARAGTVSLFKSLWDAVIDPFIGLASDRTRTKWGRRRVYLLYSAVPFGILFFMLWTSFGLSAGADKSKVMVYYIVVGILFNTAQSLIQVPHEALLPELAPGYFERTQYVSITYLCNTIGMPASFFLSSAFMGFVNTKKFTPGERPMFLRIGLILGAAYIAPILLSALKTKEKSSKDLRPPPLDLRFFFNEYLTVFKNKAFVQYFMTGTMVFFCNVFFLNSRLYFIYETVGAESSFNLIATLAGIAEVVAFPVNFALVKKFGKARMARYTTPFLFLSLALTFVIGRHVPGAGIPWMLIALFAQEMLNPFGQSGVNFALETIAPDITDVDEMITGRRREGVIATFRTFIRVSLKGVTQFFIGVILEWFGVETGAEGEKDTLFKARAANLLGPKLGGPLAGMRLVHGALPMVFAGLALLFLRRYTMTRGDHKLMQELIREKRETGAASVTPEQRARLEEIAGQKWDEMWIGAGEERAETAPLI